MLLEVTHAALTYMGVCSPGNVGRSENIALGV